MSTTFNPEVNELREKVAALDRQVSELSGRMHEMDKLVATVNRQSTFQIAFIVITLCLTIAGGLYFQTTTLDKRLDQTGKRFDERFQQVERRLDRVDRNLDQIGQEWRAKK